MAPITAYVSKIVTLLLLIVLCQAIQNTGSYKIEKVSNKRFENHESGKISRSPKGILNLMIFSRTRPNHRNEARRPGTCSSAEPTLWVCYGHNLTSIPEKLNPKPKILVLESTGITVLSKNALAMYDTIVLFSMEYAPELQTVESGAFSNLTKLRLIYIRGASKLVSFNLAQTYSSNPSLKMIRINYSDLKRWPNLTQEKGESELDSIELEFNKITTLGKEPIEIQTGKLGLEGNDLTEISENTFSGSTIATLSLAQNRRLMYIHERAFAMLNNLNKLDLSDTSLIKLPTAGLEHLRILVLANTWSMKRIPSIYAFPNLEEANLTYQHHCCAFRFPQAHDPSEYAKHRELQQTIDSICVNRSLGELVSSKDSRDKLTNQTHIVCGELAALSHIDARLPYCYPEPDDFNPCEDLMVYPILRVAVWLVAGAAVLGNLSVIIVHIGIFHRLSVARFLQLNLAIGDFVMGLYLSMLALADLNSVGTYFNYALDWQQGYGCKLAGLASMFASQLSIFTLSVITFERYFTITHSMDLNMRLKLGWAARIMALGWIYAFVWSILPIFADVSSYSLTSICLPLRITNQLDKLYIIILLVIDGSAFIIIFACYLRMYLLIRSQKTEASANERTIALRMALLVFTDFACWAPIIFFATTAMLGKPLIDVTNSKILIVFFYPLNSLANPYLYVISTRQYKRDLRYLVNRIWRYLRNLMLRTRNEYLSPTRPDDNAMTPRGFYRTHHFDRKKKPYSCPYNRPRVFHDAPCESHHNNVPPFYKAARKFTGPSLVGGQARSQHLLCVANNDHNGRTIYRNQLVVDCGEMGKFEPSPSVKPKVDRDSKPKKVLGVESFDEKAELPKLNRHRSKATSFYDRTRNIISTKINTNEHPARHRSRYRSCTSRYCCYTSCLRVNDSDLDAEFEQNSRKLILPKSRFKHRAKNSIGRKRKNFKLSKDVHSKGPTMIDILGNLSANEPTSSTSSGTLSYKRNNSLTKSAKTAESKTSDRSEGENSNEIGGYHAQYSQLRTLGGRILNSVPSSTNLAEPRNTQSTNTGDRRDMIESRDVLRYTRLCRSNRHHHHHCRRLGHNKVCVRAHKHNFRHTIMSNVIPEAKSTKSDDDQEDKASSSKFAQHQSRPDKPEE